MIVWSRLVKYDLNSWIALQYTPKHFIIARKISWLIVSNSLLKSNRTGTELLLLSEACVMSLSYKAVLLYSCSLSKSQIGWQEEAYSDLDVSAAVHPQGITPYWSHNYQSMWVLNFRNTFYMYRFLDTGKIRGYNDNVSNVDEMR